MANKKYIFQPNYAIHPGEYLEELLDARGMSQAELAIRLGISKKHVSNIINGKASVTVDIAHALEKVFSDYSAKYWLSIQNTYDLFQQREKTDQQYSAAEEETKIWLAQFDYSYLVKAGYVKETARGTDDGGRGITVCNEWHDPNNFINWSYTHGYQDGLQIDRVDNDQGYSPDNCRWVTAKENSRNRRNTVRLTINGETKSVAEWTETIDISPFTIYWWVRTKGEEYAENRIAERNRRAGEDG